jgi:hypothetical protein
MFCTPSNSGGCQRVYYFAFLPLPSAKEMKVADAGAVAAHLAALVRHMERDAEDREGLILELTRRCHPPQAAAAEPWPSTAVRLRRYAATVAAFTAVFAALNIAMHLLVLRLAQ